MGPGHIAYITSRPLLYEIETLHIYTCADRIYIINCQRYCPHYGADRPVKNLFYYYYYQL